MANAPRINDDVRLHGTVYVGKLLDLYPMPGGKLAFVSWDKSMPGWNERPISALCSLISLIKIELSSQ